MKTSLIATALFFSSISQANALMTCKVTDSANNSLVYAFGENTQNTNGIVGGTFVETYFIKNGALTVSPIGRRPIWLWSGYMGGVNVYSRNNPGWTLNASATGTAMLIHNGMPIAFGSCVVGVDQYHVEDQGL